MKILILDNYDSFTHNLFHYIEQFSDHVDVIRNDKFNLDELQEYDGIILSPGPGLPKDAGMLMDILKKVPKDTAVLGVCLGLQAIVEFYGGKLTNLKQVLHGVATECNIVKADPIFNEIGPKFKAGHYHSWVADSDHFPENLEVLSQNENGLIMAIRHKTKNIRAVQFHPESIMTPDGLLMIKNWVDFI